MGREVRELDGNFPREKSSLAFLWMHGSSQSERASVDFFREFGTLRFQIKFLLALSARALALPASPRLLLLSCSPARSLALAHSHFKAFLRLPAPFSLRFLPSFLPSLLPSFLPSVSQSRNRSGYNSWGICCRHKFVGRGCGSGCGAAVSADTKARATSLLPIPLPPSLP